MRRLTARVLLGIAAVLSLLLALSLPAPGNVTTGQAVAQLALFVLSVLSVIAAVLLSRRPTAGWALSLMIGAVGLTMLLWRGWPLYLLLRDGGATQQLSAIVPLLLWSAQVVIGGCALSWVRTRVAKARHSQCA